MNLDEIEKLTVEEIEAEVKKMISWLRKTIAEEERRHYKTSNYKQYKERLPQAEELLAEMKEDREIGIEQKSFMYSFRLARLMQPIY